MAGQTAAIFGIAAYGLTLDVAKSEDGAALADTIYAEHWRFHLDARLRRQQAAAPVLLQRVQGDRASSDEVVCRGTGRALSPDRPSSPPVVMPAGRQLAIPLEPAITCLSLFLPDRTGY